MRAASSLYQTAYKLIYIALHALILPLFASRVSVYKIYINSFSGNEKYSHGAALINLIEVVLDWAK